MSVESIEWARSPYSSTPDRSPKVSPREMHNQKHAAYATRVKTFPDTWKGVKPSTLAANGIYYVTTVRNGFSYDNWGQRVGTPRDSCRGHLLLCFSCGYSFEKFTTESDFHHKHRKHASNCRMVEAGINATSLKSGTQNAAAEVSRVASHPSCSVPLSLSSRTHYQIPSLFDSSRKRCLLSRVPCADSPLSYDRAIEGRKLLRPYLAM